jgi:hypothetical protein
VTQMVRPRNSHWFDIPVRLRGVFGHADVEVDLLEHDRRRAAGISGRALGPMGALDALLTFPERVSVPVEQVDPVLLAKAAQSQAALVYPSPETVCRVGRPAASIRLFSLPTSDWRRGIQQAHRLAPYSARRLVLSTEPKSVDRLLLEASYWGIGVLIRSTEGERELLAPGEFSPTRYTGAAWLFDEDVYTQVWSQHHTGASWLDQAVA